MTDQPTPIKGFRKQPLPTKSEVVQENQTLAQQLAGQLQGMQKLFSNLIQQVMTKNKEHEQQLVQLNVWLTTTPTAEPAAKGDSVLMDYAGMLLDEAGVPAQLVLQDSEGKEVKIPDIFDGGHGEFFVLNNLGGGTLIGGFEEQIIGMKAGEFKKIQVTFPKDYGVATLAGKTAEFNVYLHDVRKVYAPSQVGNLISELNRLKSEARARAIAIAQAAKEAEAKKADAAAISDAEVVSETPAPAAESAHAVQEETQPETSDNSAGTEQTPVAEQSATET